MGKQKTVISVTLKNEKARTKALKIAVGQPGVVAASIQVEKGQIEVMGEFDPVVLATTLRKKLGRADLLTVGAVVEKKDEPSKPNKPAATKEEPPKTQTVTISNPLTYYPPPFNSTLYTSYPVPHYYNDEDVGCTVM